MQKQKKNLKFKSIRRLRNLFKNNKTAINPLLYLLNKKFSFIVNFKIKRNNVFCSLIETTNKKTLLLISSGKEKIKTSKKIINFSSKIIFNLFFKKIKKVIKGKNILVNITGPTREKRLLIKTLHKLIKNIVCYLHVNHKKCFNGCKPSKKRRKKQRSLRIFK